MGTICIFLGGLQSIQFVICALDIWGKPSSRCFTHIPDSKVHGPKWGPSGADRTQVGPMLAPWICNLGWWHRYGPTFAEVMVCCLTIPSYNLKQCKFSHQRCVLALTLSNFTISAHEFDPWYLSGDCTFAIITTYSRVQLVNAALSLSYLQYDGNKDTIVLH